MVAAHTLEHIPVDAYTTNGQVIAVGTSDNNDESSRQDLGTAYML